MLDTAVSVTCLLSVFVPPAAGAWLVVRGVRARTWRCLGWFAHVSWVSLYLAAAFWLYGAWAGGLDPEEACGAAGQRYDPDYRGAHYEQLSRLFPLSNNCNAHYDLVPAWVNPAVAGFALLLVVGLVGMVAVTVRPRARWTSPPGQTQTRTGSTGASTTT